MLDADLSHYGMRVHSINTMRDEFGLATSADEITVTLKSFTNVPGSTSLPEQLISDMTVMNQVRLSVDPAVQAAYEQMLTVMALTKGRVYEADTTATKK